MLGGHGGGQISRYSSLREMGHTNDLHPRRRVRPQFPAESQDLGSGLRDVKVYLLGNSGGRHRSRRQR
jgi:hypothetical protein